MPTTETTTSGPRSEDVGRSVRRVSRGLLSVIAYVSVSVMTTSTVT